MIVPRPAAEIRPVLSSARVGRRRRPSGEPPPLPRRVEPSTAWYLGLGVLTLAFWIAMRTMTGLRMATQADVTILRAIATLRTGPVTAVMRAVNALGSPWVVRGSA